MPFRHGFPKDPDGEIVLAIAIAVSLFLFWLIARC